ncbi:MAG: hypothetical protein KGJ13_08545 [Patescibacteria group bacterium]|nr:hypothetical protein [Patescibacteria group bacterium]
MADLAQALQELDPATRDRVIATLRAGDTMAALLQDAEAAQVVSSAADRLAKKRNPAIQTADDIAQRYADQVLAKVDQKLSERDKKTSQERAEAELTAKIDSLKSSENFTDEGIQGVLKLMQERGVADIDIAAREYRREHPAPNPQARMTERMRWNVEGQMQAGSEKPFFFPEDGTPSVVQDPETWAQETALKYLNNEIELPA